MNVHVHKHTHSNTNIFTHVCVAHCAAHRMHAYGVREPRVVKGNCRSNFILNKISITLKYVVLYSIKRVLIIYIYIYIYIYIFIYIYISFN